MTRYAGLCYDSGGWGGDLTGVLFRETPEGWDAVAGHISSDAAWSEHDIRRHFGRRDDPSPDDEFAWAGRVQTQADIDRFVAAHPPVPTAAT